jgi:outer membrane protein assembly factor BamB
MNHDEAFPPDTIDEQVDQFASVSSHESLPPGREVIPRLSALYKADQHSTERVWERLAQHLTEYNASVQACKAPETVQERHKARRPMMHPPLRLSRRTGSSWFAQVAAAVFAALLVGSLLWVLHLAQPIRTAQTVALAASPPGLYINRSDGVYRLNAQTRKVIWHTHLAGQTPFAGIPVVIGDTLYITTGGTLSALNAQSGSLRWARTFKQSVLPPYLSDGLLYINVSMGSTLYAVNPVDGTITATYMPKQGFWNTPIVVHGVLYYTAGSSLYAVQLPGEKLLWQQQVSTRPLRAGLCVYNGIVYVQVMQFVQKIQDTVGLIDTFDAHTGHKLWQSPAMPRGVSIVAITGEMLYAAAFGELLTFDVHTHALVWHQPFNTFEALVASGRLYISYDLVSGQATGHESFAALNATTGKLLWQKSNGGGGGVALAGMLDGVLYGIFWTGQGVGTAYALNASSGSQLWTMPAGATVFDWRMTVA